MTGVRLCATVVESDAFDAAVVLMRSVTFLSEEENKFVYSDIHAGSVIILKH